jgi:acyl-CoA-dependent ceramide synthase
MADTMPVQPLERKERNAYVSSGARPAKETTFREWVVTNQIGTRDTIA